MGLDRGRRDDEVVGDLRVRHALRHEDEDLPLARRERGDTRFLLGLVGAVLGQVGGEHLQHAARDPRGDDRLAARHCADRVGELRRARVLEQEARRAGLEPGEGVLVQVEGRQDEDLRARALTGDLRRRVDPVDPGHADVHEDDVRLEGAGLREGGGAVGGLAHDLDPVLGVEDHAEPHAHERLVVGEDDRHRPPAGSAGSGLVTGHIGICHGVVPSSSSSQRSTARTLQPVSVGPASTVPP